MTSEIQNLTSWEHSTPCQPGSHDTRLQKMARGHYNLTIWPTPWDIQIPGKALPSSQGQEHPEPNNRKYQTCAKWNWYPENGNRHDEPCHQTHPHLRTVEDNLDTPSGKRPRKSSHWPTQDHPSLQSQLQPAVKVVLIPGIHINKWKSSPNNQKPRRRPSQLQCHQSHTNQGSILWSSQDPLTPNHHSGQWCHGLLWQNGRSPKQPGMSLTWCRPPIHQTTCSNPKWTPVPQA